MEAIEERLRAQLADLDARLEKLAAAPERGSGVSFGKRVGDGTTEAIGRLTDVGVGSTLEATRDRVAAALARIEEGTYGDCASCGEPIDPRRLAVAPESTLCIDCARAGARG